MGTQYLVPETPTRTGYVFTGWTPNINNSITGRTTFVAQWEQQKFTIGYYSYYWDYVYGDPPDKVFVIKGNETHTIAAHYNSVRYESVHDQKEYYNVGQVLSIDKNSGKHDYIYIAPPYSPN